MSEESSISREFRAGSPSAAAVAWRWRADSPEVAAITLRRRLRREGLVRALIGGAVGGALLFFGAQILAGIAWFSSGLVLLAALASPDGLYAAIGRALARLGRAIGRLLGILLLTPLFFLFFLPFGRLLRSGRNDRLERWFDRAKPTYWQARHDAPRTKSSYERAF